MENAPGRASLLTGRCPSLPEATDRLVLPVKDLREYFTLFALKPQRVFVLVIEELPQFPGHFYLVISNSSSQLKKSVENK